MSSPDKATKPEKPIIDAGILMHTRAQTGLLNPGEHTAALHEVFSELLLNDAALRRIVSLVQGTDTHYEFPTTGNELHPLVGRWTPG